MDQPEGMTTHQTRVDLFLQTHMHQRIGAVPVDNTVRLNVVKVVLCFQELTGDVWRRGQTNITQRGCFSSYPHSLTGNCFDCARAQ